MSQHDVVSLFYDAAPQRDAARVNRRNLADLADRAGLKMIEKQPKAGAPKCCAAEDHHDPYRSPLSVGDSGEVSPGEVHDRHVQALQKETARADAATCLPVVSGGNG